VTASLSLLLLNKLRSQSAAAASGTLHKRFAYLGMMLEDIMRHEARSIGPLAIGKQDGEWSTMCPHSPVRRARLERGCLSARCRVQMMFDCMKLK
jgi:hypothetical protein